MSADADDDEYHVWLMSRSQQQAIPSGGKNLFGMMQGGSRMDSSGQANLNFTQENGLGNSNTTFDLNGAGNDIYGAGAGDG